MLPAISGDINSIIRSPISQIGSDPALKCVEVSANYSSIEVCFGISLETKENEILGIIGPNGAGKSTFLGALAGVVSNQGEIWIRGRPLHGLPSHLRALAGLAFVPEVRGNIFPNMTVRENLLLSSRSLERNKAERCISDSFELFAVLKEKLDIAAGLLSGGEQQMLAIAMAVARQPAVLLLDEPTQGLAPSIYESIEYAIRKLSSKGVAVIVAEQNVPFLARLVSRYVALAGGRVVGSGLAKDLHDEASVIRMYFGAR